MSAEILEQAFSTTQGVLARVSTDQLDLPTPCASWPVRDLVNHIVGGTYFFAIAAETGAAPSRGDAPDFTAGDMSASFEEGAKRAVAAFSAEGAMDKLMTVPLGVLPGSAFVWVAAIDTFVHGWDLAKATGQSADLDAGLATQLLKAARGPMSDSLRGPDGKAPFGPEVDASDSASAADRLAAFLGRTP
jgi:uncharacterized protein (TIGR03086 family)